GKGDGPLLRVGGQAGLPVARLVPQHGGFEGGEAALVDLDRLTTQPVYHPISQLVYAAGREQVNHVWVGGRHVVEEGRLTTLEPAMLRDKARHWQTCLAANA
ncbi:MAG: TRZ/ATZ family hydrolase, partial [Thiohalospira sp.]